MEWLNSIRDLADIIARLTDYSRGNKAVRAQLVRELKINLKAFEVQRRRANTDYDLLLNQLSNKVIRKQFESGYSFSRVKNGTIQGYHIHDLRNRKYIGRDCRWMFEHIDMKIVELHLMRESLGSLNHIQGVNMALQFSNLYHRIRVLADFIC